LTKQSNLAKCEFNELTGFAWEGEVSNKMPHSAEKPSAGITPLTGGGSAFFSTTQWSMVLAAGQGDLTRSAAALEKLCQRYWPPIYAFIRRRGSDTNEAEDLTQSFFAHLLDQETLQKVDPRKGKFRNFILASLTKFLANERDKEQAWKRGGRAQIISLDAAGAEEFFLREPAKAEAPGKLFDRRWAALLVERVMARLKEEYAKDKKAELFVKLEPGLTGELKPGWLAGLGASQGLSETTMRVALHKLRRKFGELLRREVAQTVSSAAEVDEEIRQLFSSLSV
jgi:DNA-directed RNA polymerase specialized sigma24 family protein